MLYSAISLCYYVGTYRILESKHFAKVIGIGFGFDILFTLSLLVLQLLNNEIIDNHYVDKYVAAGSFTIICILLKFLLCADLILELLMFLYELYRIRNLSQ